MTLRTTLAALALAMAVLAAPAHAGTEGETATSIYGLTLGAGLIARTGKTIRAHNLRRLTPASSWIEDKRALRAPVIDHPPRYTHWIKYRSPYALARRTIRIHVHVEAPPIDLYLPTCRFLADCPCRFLAGC